MAATLLKSGGKTILKVGIATGAIAVTVKQGVWSSDSSQGVSALKNVRENVLPEANKYLEQIPSPSVVSKDVKTHWNQGIQSIFQYLSKAPKNTVNFVKEQIENISKK